MISGGLLQGFRRIEVMRLTIKDARNALETGLIRVIGKGRKERGIPIHPDFARILGLFLSFEREFTEGELLIPYGRTKAERILEEFCQRFGRRFTFHTLRRSFGRQLWLRGIQIEIIAEILGHESMDMTRKYLGLNISDMERAILSTQGTPEIVTEREVIYQVTKKKAGLR